MTTLAIPTSTKYLQNGDHLKWDEFVLRCDQTKDLPHTELIFGKVYMNAQRLDLHDEPADALRFLLRTYANATFGVRANGETTLQLRPFNGPKPDMHIRLTPEVGGKSYLENGYLTGAPELIIEVAASTASYDLYEKKELYEQIGVLEYIFWRTEDAEFDAFDLIDGSYKQRELMKDQPIESRVFPGLVLDTTALLNMNDEAAILTLQKGLASLAHAAFVADLQARKK